MNELLSAEDKDRLNPGFEVGGYFIKYQRVEDGALVDVNFPVVDTKENAFYSAKAEAEAILNAKKHVVGTLVWRPYAKGMIGKRREK